ncbi:MAG: PTS sugar transporter subunit IIC [Blautia massiliensis (ex Durand et al. 2017)]|uniref:PTS sugar transporter subunit IIC n=1 Tax=Blautia massiliensis (ex Durand et al. 2017) TaxID=1737424 RepID=UPI0039954275
MPDVVMNGLTVCGGLLPAVGMAMLMKMLWDNKICMFYFLGFVLAAYLKLPLIALAVIGVIIAISIGMNDYKLNQLAAQRVAASPVGGSDEYLDEEEEEFFS